MAFPHKVPNRRWKGGMSLTPLGDALLDPFRNFVEHVGYSSRAGGYPLGEFASRFQAPDVRPREGGESAGLLAADQFHHFRSPS